MPGKLSDMTDQELLVIANVGFDAENFITNNDLYLKHIKPGLVSAMATAKRDGDWKPNKTTDPVAISVFNAYNSGKQDGLDEISAVITRLKNQGKSAGEEYERRKKKEGKKQ